MEFSTVINWNSPFLFQGMLGGIFHFHSSFNRKANSRDLDQMPHSVASDLGLHYLPRSHKKDARHIWVKMQLFCLSHKSCRNLGSILLKKSS